ncbi:MAG TPA: hypothetical protein VHT70_01970 [Candidatus Saccharimonadales bacterium]|jgi:hypothetical protein|nr:hypothetical protein [Candidatus Saccharimonadales bacterium]
MLERANSTDGPHFEPEYSGLERNALIVPGKFNISWAPTQISSLDSADVERFAHNIAAVRAQMERETTIGEEAMSGRVIADQDFADILTTPSVAIDYPNRNLRYRSDGTFMPLNPTDEIVEPPYDNGQIPNLWNDPA